MILVTKLYWPHLVTISTQMKPTSRALPNYGYCECHSSCWPLPSRPCSRTTMWLVGHVFQWQTCNICHVFFFFSRILSLSVIVETSKKIYYWLFYFSLCNFYLFILLYCCIDHGTLHYWNLWILLYIVTRPPAPGVLGRNFYCCEFALFLPFVMCSHLATHPHFVCCCFFLHVVGVKLIIQGRSHEIFPQNGPPLFYKAWGIASIARIFW